MEEMIYLPKDTDISRAFKATEDSTWYQPKEDLPKSFKAKHFKAVRAEV